MTSLGITVATLAPSSARAGEDNFASDIQPLIAQYCYGCHDADLTKGDLNIARFETAAMVNNELGTWQRMAKRITNKEMPPRKKPQPTDEERQRILDWINSRQPDTTECNRISSEASESWYVGYVMSRRLTRAEYENTLRDLLGLDIEVSDQFPADGAGGEGFDNNGGSLFLSAIQAEKYLEAANQVMDTVFPWEHYNPVAGAARGIGRMITFRWGKSETEQAAAAARDRLIAFRPGRGLSEEEAAAQSLAAFAGRAWRRPIGDEETARLMEMYTTARERGDGYVSALKLAFTAVLISPNFLFLAEPEPADAGVYALGDYPLAARLSYFLWATMPDEELFDLAQDGKLQDDEELKRQVDRMLRDPKARGLGAVFAAQWLGIVDLGGAKKPDEEAFPEYDEALLASMREQTTIFFQQIVAEDRSLLELIDSDYTFADERIAAIYGFDLGPETTGMQRVQLADARHGGVLGMPSILTATSHPLRTSPVLRGKWVLEQLLGESVPPPPPNVPSLPEEDHHPEGLSFREQLERHRENPDCASCHARMDPLGFGLENFDPIGRWREDQGGQPVDASGVLPSGEGFNGPAELKALLLSKKDQFIKNLSRKMLGYALGRNLDRNDSCVIDDTVEALQLDGYRASNLFREIALSYPFRHRYSGGAHTETES